MGAPMSHRHTVFTAVALCLGLSLAPIAAQAQTDTDAAVQKTLKTLVNSIRYGKDDLAAKQLAFGAMAKGLLTDDWGKFSAAEQAELASGLETVIRAMSFKKGKDMFQYLDALLFDAAKVSGDKARVRSTIVVHRELKKAEIIIEWVLVNEGGAWKVLDTVMLGESTMASLRDDQVKPLFKQGGVAAVMKAMRDKVAETKKT
jgi:phospholipid transport system substrate-binding protein